MTAARRTGSGSLKTPRRLTRISSAGDLVMLPSICAVIQHLSASGGAFDSDVADVVSEQPERLVDADPIDGLPVLGDKSVLESEEVERREVHGSAALRDGAVPHA